MALRRPLEGDENGDALGVTTLAGFLFVWRDSPTHALPGFRLSPE